MECIICLKKIKLHEQIFWGNQMECSGPGEDDCSYSGDSEGLMGAICLLCLKSPAVTFRVPNTEVPERVNEKSKPESIVERSDALSLLDGV